jgi:hypothetical protein
MSRLWWLSMLLCTPWIIWLAAEYYYTHDQGLLTTVQPEYSFLASLHGFLLKHANENTAEERLSREESALKVYVYEMPAKFTTDLLWLFHDSLEQTANLTSNGSPVHRLIEQVLTVYRP